MVTKYGTAYVSSEGTFGIGNVILFDDDDITDKQWRVIDTLPDSMKFGYVEAILKGQEDLSHWEVDYE
jgi:AAA+ superfamily predicted ATPase